MDWKSIVALSVFVLFLAGFAVIAIAALRAWRRREKFSWPALDLADLGGEAGSPPAHGEPEAAPSVAPPPSQSVNFWAGWYLFGLMMLLGGVFTYFMPPVGIAILGIAAVYLGTNLHEVRSPSVAFLFRMGEMIGQIDAGWYLTIPHFWTIEPISRETVELHLPGQEMYTKAKRPITLHIRVFYQVVELEKALLTRNVINNRVRAVVLAKLKGKVGEKQFSDLLEERGQLEEQIRDAVSGELEPDGYKVTGIEIEDLDENVESRAEVIREIGRARGDAARALAEPLKDNYPAAVVSALGSLTEAAERVVSTIWRRQATPTQPTSPERGEGGGVAQQLTEVAREITGRRR